MSIDVKREERTEEYLFSVAYFLWLFSAAFLGVTLDQFITRLVLIAPYTYELHPWVLGNPLLQLLVVYSAQILILTLCKMKGTSYLYSLIPVTPIYLAAVHNLLVYLG